MIIKDMKGSVGRRQNRVLISEVKSISGRRANRMLMSDSYRGRLLCMSVAYVHRPLERTFNKLMT